MREGQCRVLVPEPLHSTAVLGLFPLLLSFSRDHSAAMLANATSLAAANQQALLEVISVLHL